MLKFNAQEKTNSVRGALQLRPEIEKIADTILRDGFDTLFFIGITGLSASMLRGVAKLIVTFGDELNDEAFKDRISQHSLKVLTRTAKDRRMGSLGYSEALVLAYNRKCKLKTKMLNIKKLYGDIGGDDGDFDDDDENADSYA